jgi:hypothetical protein
MLNNLMVHYNIKTDKMLAQKAARGGKSSAKVAAHNGEADSTAADDDYAASILREIYNWKCGKDIPSCKKFVNIVSSITCGNEAAIRAAKLSYIIRRFTQELYLRCDEMISQGNSGFLEQKELFAEFEKYTKWYSLHEARYATWERETRLR